MLLSLNGLKSVKDRLILTFSYFRCFTYDWNHGRYFTQEKSLQRTHGTISRQHRISRIQQSAWAFESQVNINLAHQIQPPILKKRILNFHKFANQIRYQINKRKPVKQNLNGQKKNVGKFQFVAWFLDPVKMKPG